jgi:small subunit ribosomal protein S2
MTKKETQMLNREKVKLADQHRGIKDMKRLPDALIVVDAQYEDTAIKEAKRLEIPVVAIVDSNTNPKKVDYPIPANDDSMRTIQLIISALADSVLNASGKSSEEETRTDETETKDSVQKTTVRNLSEKDQQSSNEELDDVKQEEE